MSVDIVSDVMCPWCIIGWLQFEKVMAHFADRLNFRVKWHPFELNPDMPAEGEDASSHVMRKYGVTADQGRSSGQRIAGIAAELGFVMKRGPGFRMRNSFDAHRLLCWAGSMAQAEEGSVGGQQTALKLALFRAHFTDQRDVSDHHVLADVAASVGLDRDRAMAILSGPEFGDIVRDEEAYWAEQNIMAVPSFILDGRMIISGAQNPEAFIRVIERKLLGAVTEASEAERRYDDMR